MHAVRLRALTLGLLSILAFSLAACASSDRVALSGPAMSPGAPAAPPEAYLDYCVRQPGECGVDPKLVDARQTVTRRYWRAVFAASDPHMRGGRIDWAGVASAIDEAPAATSADAGGSAPSAVTPDQFLNRHGGPEMIAAIALNASSARGPLDSAAPHRVTWDAPTRRRVAEINRAVNSAIVERPDIVTYGLEDYWAIPTLKGEDRYGDCEDYALMKRRDLIAAGIAADALSLAVVKTERGASHAVLLIETDRGDFVLDNLDGSIRAWTETNYRWMERQAPGSAFAWMRPGSPVATAILPHRATPAASAYVAPALYWGRPFSHAFSATRSASPTRRQVPAQVAALP